MSMCNQVVQKNAGGFAACPAAAAIFSNPSVAAFIIKLLNAAPVWSACGQSERK